MAPACAAASKPEILPYGVAPAAAGGEEIPFDLLAAVLRALPDIFATSCDQPRGSFFEIIEDTGGHNLCDHAAMELAELLGTGSLAWICLNDCSRGLKLAPPEAFVVADPAIPDEYPYFHIGDDGEPELDKDGEKFPANDHCVLYVDGWFIDLTARQFDKRMPFPFFWRVREETS